MTAYGYQGVRRVDYERVYGGDGNWHLVPVEWIEYLPVSKMTDMRLSEADEPSHDFAADYQQSRASIFRRSIYAYL